MAWKSLATPANNDESVWQIIVPELAFKHAFLLNGVFAFTAFEIASELKIDPEAHVSAALAYQDLALGSFRDQLNNILPENHEAVLYFSTMLIDLAIASARFVSVEGGLDSQVQNAVNHFELLRGLVAVIKSAPDCIKTMPMFSNVKPMNELPRLQLDRSTKAAIDKLNEMNEKRVASSPSGPFREQVRIVQHAGSCKIALHWLKECYEACAEPVHREYSLAWIAFAGDGYLTAIKDKDRIALLMLMFWGILIENIGKNATRWWARGFGRTLAEEVSIAFINDPDETTKDVIQWAREQVGVDTGW